MKEFMKHFSCLLMAMLACIALPSCGDDDDEPENVSSYPSLILGKWYNTANTSQYWSYDSDGYMYFYYNATTKGYYQYSVSGTTLQLTGSDGSVYYTIKKLNSSDFYLTRNGNNYHYSRSGTSSTTTSSDDDADWTVSTVTALVVHEASSKYGKSTKETKYKWVKKSSGNVYLSRTKDKLNTINIASRNTDSSYNGVRVSSYTYKCVDRSNGYGYDVCYFFN